jgi:predicted amidohydrolase
VKVAAYQAPLLPAGSFDAIAMIRAQIDQCERDGIAFLCCPEAILGGLADYAPDPQAIAILPGADLERVLAPLVSRTVTTVVGFTERGVGGVIYNSAAILHRGAVAGIYRKVHPAIRRSVYSAGTEAPVFTVDGLTFGILICNDSNFPDLVASMAAQGAMALFIPTNNGLPRDRDRRGLAESARATDIRYAASHDLWIIRADVAGDNGVLASDGSSGIVSPSA